eukprot:1601614-Rhodomonas_salina.2
MRSERAASFFTRQVFLVPNSAICLRAQYAQPGLGYAMSGTDVCCCQDNVKVNMKHRWHLNSPGPSQLRYMPTRSLCDIQSTPLSSYARAISTAICLRQCWLRSRKRIYLAATTAAKSLTTSSPPSWTWYYPISAEVPCIPYEHSGTDLRLVLYQVGGRDEFRTWAEEALDEAVLASSASSASSSRSISSLRA